MLKKMLFMVKTCVTFCENCVLYLKNIENQLTDYALQYVYKYILKNNKFQLLNNIFLTDKLKFYKINKIK